MGVRPGATKLVLAESPIEHVVPAMGTGYFAGDTPSTKLLIKPRMERMRGEGSAIAGIAG